MVSESFIDDAINALVNDNPEQCAQVLADLAHDWAAAGLTYKSFEDMRQHIIQSAEDQTCRAFIKEKLTIAERKLKSDRIQVSVSRH